MLGRTARGLRTARCRAVAGNAWGRLIAGSPAIVLASVAAAGSWWFAHDVLGHPHPFFAPVAAAISLTTSRLEPTARIAQLLAGVIVGIVVADAIRALLGSSPLAVGVIALATMSIAQAIGGGFLGESVFFVNQAVGSALLIVTVDRAGTAGERVVDALVGSVVAYLVSVVALPASPFVTLVAARETLLERVRTALSEVDRRVHDGDELDEQWLHDRWEEVVEATAGLMAARHAARFNARVVPRWWRRRAAIEAELDRSEELHAVAAIAMALVIASRREPGPLPPGRDP
jgi:uncharacterized membrane protein YgaE (UPF0421/DUF939 family)